jgi:ADP-ribose pyrophosphatase YjhB (NUDIX family)
MKRSAAKKVASLQYRYDYPRPAVAVDLVVSRWAKGKSGEKQRELLLIQRKHEPFAGCWALPGGFLDEHENLEQAAARELHEETRVVARKLVPLGAFSAVDRDPEVASSVLLSLRRFLRLQVTKQVTMQPGIGSQSNDYPSSHSTTLRSIALAKKEGNETPTTTNSKRRWAVAFESYSVAGAGKVGWCPCRTPGLTPLGTFSVL